MRHKILKTHSPHTIFHEGELLNGKILQSHSNGKHIILLKGQKLEAEYPGHLEGEYLFKIHKSKTLTLEIFSGDTQAMLQKLCEKFPKLQAHKKDPTMRTILESYIQNNRAIHEDEIQQIHELLRQNPIVPETLKSLLTHNTNAHKSPLKTLQAHITKSITRDK